METRSTADADRKAQPSWLARALRGVLRALLFAFLFGLVFGTLLRCSFERAAPPALQYLGGQDGERGPGRPA
jgi:hypothetical protein